MDILHKFAASIGIILVGFFYLLFAPSATAETTAGLKVDVYTYDSSRTPERQPYTFCDETNVTAWSEVSQIADDWADGVIAGCQGDFVLIHYYGYITAPVTGDITFQSIADDGFYMEIGGEPVIDNWWLKECSGGSGTHYFEKDVSQYIDVWWYEYGGWACNTLYWDVEEVNVVPASAFTQNEVKPEVTPTPTVDPTVEPTPEPTDPPVEPTPTPTPSITPEEPPVVPPVVPELPPTKPTPEATPEPTPVEIPLELPIIEPPTSEEIVAQLWAEAQADDIIVPEQLANVPVLGAVVQGLANIANFIGNVGTDMTPEVRVTAQKTVVAAVVVGQIAQTAAMAASIRKVK